MVVKVVTLPLLSVAGRMTDHGPIRTCSLPYFSATSINLAYSGFFEAARIKEGLVVASCGLYLAMAEVVVSCGHDEVNRGPRTCEVARVANHDLHRIVSKSFLDAGRGRAIRCQ